MSNLTSSHLPSLGANLQSVKEITKMKLGVLATLFRAFNSSSSNLKRVIKHVEQLNELSDDVLRKVGSGNVPKAEVKKLLEDVETINHQAEEMKRQAKSRKSVQASILKIKSKMEELREVLKSPSLVEKLAISKPRSFCVKLPTSRLFGRENLKQEILDKTRDAHVERIGVCGMEGVGKTTIMKHINNQILEEKIYEKVIWVTMSENLDTTKLQKDIMLALNKGAQSIFSDLSDVMRREHLIKMLHEVKYVLILDGMSESVSLDDVGIPKQIMPCQSKLIITTRSSEVCRSMSCEIVQVEPLPQKYSLDLFMSEVGQITSHNRSLEPIVKDVVGECAGLPLAVVSIARRMKGVDDVREWRNALNELKGSIRSIKGIESELLERLKPIYFDKRSITEQNCLLYCSLYPKGFRIPKLELVELLADEYLMDSTEEKHLNLANEAKSKAQGCNLAYELIDGLEKSYLLVGSSGSQDLKMYDLVRGMALHITRVSPRFMVKSGLNLEELPKEEEWEDDLERVSLMQNSISEIPNLSLKCSKLKTLLMNSNPLKFIPNSFFFGMTALMTLDLSDTLIKSLPQSVVHLTNLTTMLLGRCIELNSIPSLEQLKRLRKLDLVKTAMDTVPHGIRQLTDLRFLDLRAKYLKEIQVENFSNLQFSCFSVHCGEVVMDEVFGVKNTGMIVGQYWDIHDYNLIVKDVGNRRLSSYTIQAGPRCPLAFDFIMAEYRFGKNVVLRQVDECAKRDGSNPNLPENVEFLKIMEWRGLSSLCDISHIYTATSLKHCEVEKCDELKYLFLFSSVSPNPKLQNLEKIRLRTLKNLNSIFHIEGRTPTSSVPSPDTFSNLKHLCIVDCPKVKALFTLRWLRCLGNLEEIVVGQCNDMEEIVASTEEKTRQTMIGKGFRRLGTTKYFNNYATSLPKLKLLDLRNLPELKSICAGELVCYSLREIKVLLCPKLERLPLTLPLPPYLRRITSYQMEWWNSLLWDSTETRDALQPFLRQW